MVNVTSTTSKISHLTSHPAYLYIGSRQAMVARAIEDIQQTLCLRNGCYTCITCRQITQGNHHAILWLTTTKGYTLEDVQKVHETLRFSIEPATHFFIIIEYAERLNASSANSLLTSMEEPPAGYHFILLVENADQLLPTIRSRSVIRIDEAVTTTPVTHSLLLCFTTHNVPDALSFLQELETANISEQETMALLDMLLVHWHNICKTYLVQSESVKFKKAQSILNLCLKALEHPPMPGSSKLFWKNFLLSFLMLYK